MPVPTKPGLSAVRLVTLSIALLLLALMIALVVGGSDTVLGP